MGFNNGRAGETLTRKDTIFAAINSLALMDKRTIAKKLNIETVSDLENVLTQLADNFRKYIENGRAENGSTDSTLLECAGCFSNVPESGLYERMKSGGVIVFCKRCFDIAVQEDSDRNEVDEYDRD